MNRLQKQFFKFVIIIATWWVLTYNIAVILNNGQTSATEMMLSFVLVLCLESFVALLGIAFVMIGSSIWDACEERN